MASGEVITDGWQSPEVAEELDMCLSCKGCKRDCPVGVDVATYKAEFHAQHYRGRLHPAEHYAMGLLPTWARLAEIAPGVANAIAGLSPVKRLDGIDPSATLPQFAKATFRDWFTSRPHSSNRGERVLPRRHSCRVRAEEADDLPAGLQIQEEVGVVVLPGTQPEPVARPETDQQPVIEMCDISITFGAVRALDGV